MQKVFEFAKSLKKLARKALAGFQKWRVLHCPLFNRELFNQKNIWRTSKPPSWLWTAFKSSQCSSDKSVIQLGQGI